MENGHHETIKGYTKYTIKDVKQCPRCNDYYLIVDTPKGKLTNNFFRSTMRTWAMHLCVCGQPVKRYDDKFRQWNKAYNYVKPDELVDEYWIALENKDNIRLGSLRRLNEL